MTEIKVKDLNAVVDTRGFGGPVVVVETWYLSPVSGHMHERVEST